MLSRKVMSIPGLTFVAAFAVAFALSAVASASAYHTQFVSNNCTYTQPVFIGNGMTRYAALAYAYHGRFEGYQWGGGCWNDNNIDDSPGDPTKDPNTGGEGGDCSGYVFKSWFESESGADGRFWWWPILRNVHGPYNTVAFINGDGAANEPWAKNQMIPMDAFSSPAHMAILYVPNSDGTDDVMEAKGESYGTGIWTRTYRGTTRYLAVRRTGWSG